MLPREVFFSIIFKPTDVRRIAVANPPTTYALMENTGEVLFHFDKKHSRWAKRKYKKIIGITQAVKRVNAFKSRKPKLLADW